MADDELDLEEIKERYGLRHAGWRIPPVSRADLERLIAEVERLRTERVASGG